MNIDEITGLIRVSCKTAGLDDETTDRVAANAALIAKHMANKQPRTVGNGELEQRIKAAFNWKSPPTRRMTAMEICRHIGITQPTRSDAIRVADIIVLMTGRPSYKTSGQKKFIVPEQ